MERHFQQWFVELIQIISNLSVIVAAYVAIKSLYLWRSELVGKSQYDLARKIILLAYEFKDKVTQFYLLGWSNTANTLSDEEKVIMERLENTDLSPHAQSLARELHFNIKRLSLLDDVVQRLGTAQWEAEVIFEPEAANIMQPFEEIRNKLRKAINVYYNELILQDRTPYLGIAKETMDSYRVIIFDTEGNPIITETNDALRLIREKLQKYIDPRIAKQPTLLSRNNYRK